MLVSYNGNGNAQLLGYTATRLEPRTAQDDRGLDYTLGPRTSRANYGLNDMGGLLVRFVNAPRVAS
jgi:hypothetical protein